jgi:ABC-2 type transport system ATP-binding protein
VIYLETDNNVRAEELMVNFPSVRQINGKTKGFTLVVTEDSTKVLPGVIDHLRAAGIEITTISLKKPSMDDVFVYYTGKEIRDEEKVPARPRSTKSGRR